MSEEKKNEILYLIMDDTDEVIKEPIPVKTPEIEELTKRLIKEFKASCK